MHTIESLSAFLHSARLIYGAKICRVWEMLSRTGAPMFSNMSSPFVGTVARKQTNFILAIIILVLSSIVSNILSILVVCSRKFFKGRPLAINLKRYDKNKMVIYH